LRELVLARRPDEPQFAVALLKLVLELRRRRGTLEDAIVHALRGMRVDREAFRRHVAAHRDRFVSAAYAVAGARALGRPAR